MAISINSNIGALRAIRQLYQASTSVTTAFERLSSGQRINRASDDPAGLAVSTSLGAKSRVLNRGYLNTVDGLSALNITDGAIGDLSSIFQRMGELAEQAASGTLGSSQRLNLNREYNQLDREVRRIAAATSFNGISLLSGEKVQRAGTIVSTSSSGFTYLGISGDGRYALTTTDNVLDSQLVLHDRIAGTNTILGSGANLTFNGSMSQNGDIVYSNRTTDQLYLRRKNGETIQLTNNLSVNENFSGVSMSADGRYVAFTSRTLYADGGSINNPLGTTANDRIYRMEIDTGQVRAITSDVAINNGFKLSNDGSKLAIRTSTDLLGLGDGGAEVFAVDFNRAQLNFVQATNANGAIAATRIAISDSGEVYFSDSRNLRSMNSATANQLWRYNMNDNSLEKLTNNTSGTSYSGITLSSDGSVLSFLSNSNPLGENPLGMMQAFRMDLSIGELTQLTNYSQNTLAVNPNNSMISGDGRFLYLHAVATVTNVLFDLSEGNASLDIEVGSGSAGGITALYQGLRGILGGLGNYTLTSRASALDALDKVKENIALLAQLRGEIGSHSSRLSSASALLQSQTLELQAANGRIKDADVAQEAAALTRSSILQQVGAAVLAQANIQPNLALSLLSRF